MSGPTPTGPVPARPAYPAVPAYGEGAPPRSAQAAPPAAARPTPGRPPVDPEPAARPSGVLLALALSVAWNLVALVGVLRLGWPAGNVLLLFWVENAVLGAVTLVKVLTAQGVSTAEITINGRPREGTPGLFAAFFCFHYGLFCLVHLGFTGFVAWKVGLEASFWLLGLPVVLLVLRYAVETATSWFGAGGQRQTLSSAQAMVQPYPRIIVLHLAVLGAFALVVSGLDPDGRSSWVRTAADLLPSGWRSEGVAAVALLLLAKTVVDVVTTRWALRRR